MQFERKIAKWGDSTILVLPPDLLKYIELNVGDEVLIQDDEGKHGKFISFWKKG